MNIRFEIKNLYKSYKNKNEIFPVLKGINLKIFDKKINGLIGESGSGKSTLSRIIMGMEDHQEGQILYFGKDFQKISYRDFLTNNQIMFQNPYLSVNPYLTIKKILIEPMIIKKKSKKEIQEKVDFFLDTLNIPPTVLYRYPNELSGGQLQRICLARTLTIDPEFVILDEPFSAVDEILAMELVKLFKNIFIKLNVGVLFISHHINRIQFFSDYISQIQGGKIIKSCPSTIFFNEH